MRKWIGIAVLAVVTVGVLAFVLSSPKRGSIEYLKRRHIAACLQRTWADNVRYTWNQIAGRREPWQSSYERQRKRIEFYERRLIKAGYLEQRTFVMANHPSRTAVWDNVITAWSTNFPTRPPVLKVLYTNDFIVFALGDQDMIARIRGAGSNRFVVVAPREDMPKLQELVRKADVP